MLEHDEADATDTLEARLGGVRRIAERRVAEYLVAAGAHAAPMSAQQIAAAVGTSDATVVRAARSLGFSSLRELRNALVRAPEEVELPSRLHATIAGTAAAHDILASAVERQFSSLNALLRGVSPVDFDTAAGTLAAARQLWWCGVGPSALLADYGAFLSRRIGKPAGAFTHAGPDHADELLGLQLGHVAVVLAYGRIHPYVRVLLDRAGAVGGSVVLITDTQRAVDHPAVTTQLNAGRGAPGLFATHGPTIVLVEALVLAVAAHDPQHATGSLRTLNDLRRSIAGKRLDVDPA